MTGAEADKTIRRSGSALASALVGIDLEKREYGPVTHGALDSALLEDQTS
jgi:hypothetical protein